MTPLLIGIAALAAVLVLAGVIAEAWELYEQRRDSRQRNPRRRGSGY